MLTGIEDIEIEKLQYRLELSQEHDKIMTDKYFEVCEENKRLRERNDELALALSEEPDKQEFFELKEDLDILTNKTKERDISIRKQVCYEIRKFIDNNEHSEENEAKQSSESVVYTRQLYNLLDQIEQGE